MIKKTISIIIIILALVIGVIFGVLPLYDYFSDNAADEKAYEEILEEYTLPPEETETSIAMSESEQNADPKINGYTTERTRPNFDKLLQTNKETVGWIQIPGTAINYPVVHTSDSQKYLNINFNEKSSRAGAIFSCGSVQYNPPSQNITIFGHNMGIGKSTMFSSLVKYKKESYYNEHSEIYFETPYQKGTYKIFAMFNIHVPNSTFNYTQSSFGNKNDFNNFIKKAKAMSLYNVDVAISEDAEILTLSTCDRAFAVGTGRFVVMAVKIN